MGTEKNKRLLTEIGFIGAENTGAAPSDLIVAIQADDRQSLMNVLENFDHWLAPELGTSVTSVVRTLDEAVARLPDANLAVISVPGEYASREARRSLEKGLNVFLFSDHVPIESERSLKEYARERGLIVMGPDCGTALIGGTGIGFVNAVRRGPIGVIGASGTGIQEFTTLVHHAGSGISHAIGLGSRDLSDRIGGISFLSAIDALESDPGTQVIAILSKPPGPQTLAQVLHRTLRCPKPIVTCFLGLRKDIPQNSIHHRRAHTLDDAASTAVQLATDYSPASFDSKSFNLEMFINKERQGKSKEQRYVRGLFAGGTFCYQAQQIFQDSSFHVYSNSPIEGNEALPDPFLSAGHAMIDMGADEFTVGRPHPMIDSRFRCERIVTEGQDPQVAILLLDVILGYNVSQDPARELVPAIREAKTRVKQKGGSLTVIASVCGTQEDSPGLKQQTAQLEEAGVVTFLSSSRAAFFCARLAATLQGTFHGE